MARSVKPLSLAFSPEVQEEIQGRINEESRSQRVSRDLEMLWALARHGLVRAQRKLTRGQAKLCLSIFQKTTVDNIQIGLWLGGGLVQQVEDAIQHDGAAELFDLDKDETIAAVKALTELEVFAIIDWAEQVWGKNFDIETAVERFGKD